jgi:2-oxo-4-hydroxy-4-carboxy-5-ureidoimidazoline decarboxylase
MNGAAAGPREPHALLDALAPEEARQALTRCCGSGAWVAGMLARRPFGSTAALHAAADAVWGALGRADFLEAFSHHPPIGGGDAAVDSRGGLGRRQEGADEPIAERREGAGGATRAWSAEEQARVAEAGAQAAAELRALNQSYAARFGYIFIVCATGKSADELLALLRVRLENPPEIELGVAAAEQAKITHLRLDKLAR